MIDQHLLKEFLDEKVALYNRPSFIETDPIAVPHRYQLKEDIEIAGFLAATIAWGNRKMIVQNAHKMMDLMGNNPYDFVMHYTDKQAEKLQNFVHRTFNGADFQFFMQALKYIYQNHGGLMSVFVQYQQANSLQEAIHHLHQLFFALPHSKRTEKHVADTAKGSVAKRINMYLRWMIRNDKAGVDFGLWPISSAKLSCPLDVHSGNVARKLGLITQPLNSIKALAELDTNLRKLDATDPVKYDFALFGLGVFEKFA